MQVRSNGMAKLCSVYCLTHLHVIVNKGSGDTTLVLRDVNSQNNGPVPINKSQLTANSKAYSVATSDILLTNWALNHSWTNKCFLFLPIRTFSMLTTTGPFSCTRFAPLALVVALTFSIIHQGSDKSELLSECDQR